VCGTSVSGFPGQSGTCPFILCPVIIADDLRKMGIKDGGQEQLAGENGEECVKWPQFYKNYSATE
jgi:hypothetical protein